MGAWIVMLSVWVVSYALYKADERNDIRRTERIRAEAVERHLSAERQPEDARPGGEPVPGTAALALIAYHDGWARDVLVVDMLLHRILKPVDPYGALCLMVHHPRSRGRAPSPKALARMEQAWTREQRVIARASDGSHSPLLLPSDSVVGELRQELVAEGYLRPADAQTIDVEVPPYLLPRAVGGVILLLAALPALWWDPNNPDFMGPSLTGFVVSVFWGSALLLSAGGADTIQAKLPRATARGERALAQARAWGGAQVPPGPTPPDTPAPAAPAKAVFG
ncbi:hypothetical protein ABT300_39260, partial [Streptomyces sp. NPDC001027]|uniref:hypothetical protein n=1 Tax=Streptomyces sp. NPDC001027 TaxID=3154771 RepID=UPI00331BBD8B